LIRGDSAWSLIAALSTADATTYLEDRRQKGFNAVIVNLLEHMFAPNHPNNADGAPPFTATLPGMSLLDFGTPNEAYFAHADQILNIAAQKGILIELTPAYLGYGGGSEGWYQEMKANGTAKLSTYGAYIGNRYRSFPNILWVEGGDTDPSVAGIDPTYTRAVAAGIKSADPSHLHTVHGNNGNSPLDVWPGETWLDVSNVYTYPLVNTRTPVYVNALIEYMHIGWKPFFLIESTYEGEYNATPQLIRQQAYEALLSGGMGENFGSGPIWQFASGWQTALNGRGSNDMAELHNLFTTRHWENLVPDAAHTFLTAGYGSSTSYASAALTNDGKLGIIYAPTAAPLTVALARITGQVSARWYDPTSGAFIAASASGSIFTPPAPNAAGDPDWVLVLEAP
jgi:hypothetical protein